MSRPVQGYFTKSGLRVPGASTIAGMIDDPGGLLYWANTQGLGDPVTAQEWLEHLGYAFDMAEVGIDRIDERKLDRIVSYIADQGFRQGGKNLQQARQKVMDAGTLIHDRIDAMLNNTPEPEIPEEFRAAVDTGYGAFLEWLQTTQLEPLETEKPRVSEKYQYGGTPDFVGQDPLGRIYLVDWKTGSGGNVYPSQLLQARAYGELVREVDAIGVDRYGIHKFDREHGNFHPHVYTEKSLDTAWEAFKLCRKLYEFRRQLKRIA